ncbi:MAG: DsrE family protein [Phycicoccus sp.]|nr:DsrE family protein [Phycicoccus sp.]
MAARRLVVKITSGPEALERLNQGVMVAATAVASGVTVSLWLSGESVWLAVPGHAEDWVLPHAMPMSELRDTLLQEAHVTVCSQCAVRRGLSADDLLAGAQIRGVASFVEEALQDDTTALVY